MTAPNSNAHNGTALVYLRVSGRLQEDEGTSLETQEQECLAYAQKHGYTVQHVYREVYTGHELYDRPELSRLRQEVRSGHYAAVILYDPRADRLSRRQGVTNYLMYEFDHAGCELILIGNPIDRSAYGKFKVSVDEFMAEMEREKIRDRTVGGKLARVKSGKLHNSGSELYGYRRDKERGVRIIEESEAAIVQQIFRWFVQDGVPIREIVRRLNDQGVSAPSAGKVTYADPDRVPRWGKGTLRRILTEPAYKGETIAWRWKRAENGTSVGQRDPSEHVRLPDGTTPAIVHPHTWEDAQTKLRANRGGVPRPHGRQYLLRHMIYCAVCGRRMRGDVEHDRRVYRCPSREAPDGRCEAKRVPAQDTIPSHLWPRGEDGRLLKVDDATREQIASIPGVESWVWGHVAAVLRDPATVSDEIERRREAGPDPVLSADLRGARRQLAKIEQKQKRLVALYAAGDDDLPLEVVKHQIIAAERERDQWQRDITSLEERLAQASLAVEQLEVVTDYCQRVAQNLDMFDFEEKRLALEALGVRVTANGREWTMQASLPLDTDAGREYTTCSCPGRLAVARPSSRGPCPRSCLI